MSSTEPLTHVTVHGCHLFVPRSLTAAPHRLADREGINERHFTAEEEVDDRPASSDPPTAEERRVLHELLTAAVLSATCRCAALDAPMPDATDMSEDSAGVTQPASHRTSSTLSAAETAGSPSLMLTSTTSPLTRPCHAAVPPCTSANAQTVACAVAVMLLSCALLRTAYD